MPETKSQTTSYSTTNIDCLMILPFQDVDLTLRDPCLSDIFFQGCNYVQSVHSTFPCASSRALYLDLVPSLHVQPFIRYLRRFFSRLGVTVLFISDNDKTFKASDLKQFLLKNGASGSTIFQSSLMRGAFLKGWYNQLRDV